MEVIKYTPEELGEELWGYMPQFEKQTNIGWLKEVFRVLEPEGVWVWPETLRVFHKTDSEHFVEVHDD